MAKRAVKKSNVVKREDGIVLIQVACPEEVFDVGGAFVMRRKRIAVWKLDAIASLKKGEEEKMCQIYADLIPEWEGVLDVETGEPLPNLADNPAGLLSLDSEQLTWLSQLLRVSLSQLSSADPKFGSAPT